MPKMRQSLTTSDTSTTSQSSFIQLHRNDMPPEPDDYKDMLKHPQRHKLFVQCLGLANVPVCHDAPNADHEGGVSN